MKVNNINFWNIPRFEKPAIIAGPCSAETEEQVINTAKELQKIGINVFRAGIWKPRTRPNSFEGVGNAGLEWLKLVKQETGMLTATEIANKKHTCLALRADIDILWIGARSTANPFVMQEIADALKGTCKIVLVKNPINPDVDLWIGGIERLYKAGIKNIGAIHRGFSSFEPGIYRNAPQWQIPIELKRRLPEIPLFCDPSHIAGNRNLLQNISQKALDLNFDGLMIETHCNPDKAWSDAKQQITPEQLLVLLNSLILRNVAPNGVSLNTLEDLRYKIDAIDKDMVELLGKRMLVSKLIGEYKKENNITVLQPERWDEILHRNISLGKKFDLSEEFIARIFKAIHEESINKQIQIMNGEL